jgi:hypothetical protein
MSRVELYPDWERTVQRASDPQIRARAEKALDWAIRTAPVDTGEYKSKLRMRALPGGGYRIEALADHSVFVEFGTWKMAPYHTLAVALGAART